MTEVNNGVQNKGHKPGRSILDYSLIACFTLVILLALLVLDAFEYISVPGGKGANGNIHTGIEAATGMSIMSKDELLELQKQIEDAKVVLQEKHDEVEKIVNKVEEEIKVEETPAGEPPKVETAAEKKEEEVKKEEIVEAIVEKELGIDKFCGSCQYKAMNFNCAKRVSWMIESYGITEDLAKESVLNSCHYRLRRRA
mmetsp:Transcript_31902/g.52030  ORF Transcript_31902/g.52030 Transcript_31902/m.52030 type:complete len:198 (-) Transcript_31902:55-648(-)